MHTLILVLLAILALLMISLQRTYSRVPLHELKRRVHAGDELATLLYRAAAYGHTLRAVLWFLVGISNAAFFLVISLYTPVWFALSVSAALIWVGFIWLPARDMTRFGAWIAARLAPIFGWIMRYLHGPVDHLIRFVHRHHPPQIHTGLYERDDLLELLERQEAQADNRVDKITLDIAMHALTAGDLFIRDVMVPRRKVKAVSVDDTVGPVLMSELHESGHSRFPVYQGKKDNIVGTLFLRDLVDAAKGGAVSKVMKPAVCYVHEEQPLTDALQAILKVHHHLLIVVNSQEEYAGIITLEDVLHHIIGKPIVDDFDAYEDKSAVAARITSAHPQVEEEQVSDEKPESELEEQQNESVEPENTHESNDQ